VFPAAIVALEFLLLDDISVLGALFFGVFAGGCLVFGFFWMLSRFLASPTWSTCPTCGQRGESDSVTVHFEYLVGAIIAMPVLAVVRTGYRLYEVRPGCSRCADAEL
jgi:hypothetical protein